MALLFDAHRDAVVKISIRGAFSSRPLLDLSVHELRTANKSLGPLVVSIRSFAFHEMVLFVECYQCSAIACCSS